MVHHRPTRRGRPVRVHHRVVIHAHFRILSKPGLVDVFHSLLAPRVLLSPHGLVLQRLEAVLLRLGQTFRLGRLANLELLPQSLQGSGVGVVQMVVLVVAPLFQNGNFGGHGSDGLGLGDPGVAGLEPLGLVLF